MPIYAYRCQSCNHQKEILQKIADAPPTRCPACGKETFFKQITAAGFQLKGTGWYVTDFRNSGTSKAAKKQDTQPSETQTSASEHAGENAGGNAGEKASENTSAKAVSADKVASASAAKEP